MYIDLQKYSVKEKQVLYVNLIPSYKIIFLGAYVCHDELHEQDHYMVRNEMLKKAMLILREFTWSLQNVY